MAGGTGLPGYLRTCRLKSSLILCHDFSRHTVGVHRCSLVLWTWASRCAFPSWRRRLPCLQTQERNTISYPAPGPLGWPSTGSNAAWAALEAPFHPGTRGILFCAGIKTGDIDHRVRKDVADPQSWHVPDTIQKEAGYKRMYMLWLREGDMAQQWGGLPQDPGSMFSTRLIETLSTVLDTGSRKSGALFWPLGQIPGTHWMCTLCAGKTLIHMKLE